MPLGLPRRRQLAFCIQQFGWRYAAGAGLTELPLNLISGCAELLDRPTHSSSELRQFFCSEQEQHDEQDYHHVRPHKIHDTGDRNRHKKFSDNICFVRKLFGVQSIHTELAKLYSQKVISRMVYPADLWGGKFDPPGLSRQREWNKKGAAPVVLNKWKDV